MIPTDPRVWQASLWLLHAHSEVMERVEGVPLDWSGTLVEYPESTWAVHRALVKLGRPVTEGEIGAIAEQLERASRLPDLQDVWGTEDCSVEAHRSAHELWFQRAELDTEPAQALYAAQRDTAGYRLYPDAPDLLMGLGARDVRVVIVGDIHFDIRPQFDAAGLGETIGAFVLSFEHGVQKPDPRMFTMALDASDVGARHALMVGDWYRTDGGATAVDIRTLLLPKPVAFGPRGLDTVIQLVVGSNLENR